MVLSLEHHVASATKFTPPAPSTALPTNLAKDLRIVIAGAGMSGLCLAIQLKLAGFTNFQIFEKSPQLGGTWLDNSYPNAGCDIPSFLYSFSFAQKNNWSQKYARQPEILAYFQDCCDRFDLHQHIQFNTAITKAECSSESPAWTIETSDGTVQQADFFISAVGQLNRPKLPDLPGLDQFQGPTWHSARWNHEFELENQRVAVIGNGASAIQFLPTLASRAAYVTVFQRSPNWIHPLHNYKYPGWVQSVFTKLPLTAAMHRLWIYLMCEMRFVAFAYGDSVWNRVYRQWLTSRMKALVSPEQHSQLIPDYAPGCKRILLSSDYLQTLQRPNVTLVSDSIQQVTADGITTATGHTPVDAIIYATGFDTASFLRPIDIRNSAGESLEHAWCDKPTTYLGMTTPHFPNFFMLYGPNTNLGHNSIIFMVECQVRYILKCLRECVERGCSRITVTPSAVANYDQKLRSELGNTVWNGSCSSWYKTPDGHITNNWSGTATSYWLQTRRPDFQAYQFEVS